MNPSEPPHPAQPACILEGVEKRFGKAAKPAVESLSAQLMNGAVTGLVGPDGAGKTTLLRMIAGLLQPTAGKILVGELDASVHSQELKSDIGYMPQRFGLYEDLSVRENLELHAELRGVIGPSRTVAFQRLLSLTQLEPFQARLAGRLSGGMKQKIGLACALLGKPKLLLLDEPGVGVDPISRRELWALVKELTGEGMAVVWSTAYLDEAELCSHVLLMNEGRLLYSGAPKDLTARLQGRSFLISNLKESRRRFLGRALQAPQVLDGTIYGESVRLVFRSETAIPRATDLGEPAAHLEPATPRFEDAFIDLLGGGPATESVLAKQSHEIPFDGRTVVECNRLTKRFGTFTAADAITFSVKRGEIFGLLGPNGAGKSTTFRMLCGLLKPTAGSAHVMGIDLLRSSQQARQRLGYMAQKFSLYGNLTVAQNLQFFSGAYGIHGAAQKAIIERMVSVFHLGSLLEQGSDSLPLGFKQRLALACALMHEPDVLFLDEPTSGVDPVTRREFWTHINGLVERGVTVVVTTHFMDEAEYCDRVALVSGGKLIAEGSPEELKAIAAVDGRPASGMEEAFIRLVTAERRGAITT